MTIDAQPEFEQPQPEPEAKHEGRRSAGLGAAMWIGSAATHASALALMGLIYWSVADERDIDLPPFQPPTMPVQVKERMPVTPPHVTTNTTIELPNETEVLQTETIVDMVVKEPGDPDVTSDVSDLPKGIEVAETDVAMSITPGTFMAIGPGSANMGKHGNPFGRRGDRGNKGPPGGPNLSPPVDRSLRWFKRHQSPDGMWDADNYFQNCTEEGAKCEPGKNQSGNTDVATTAYAVLCFLGDGYDTSTPSKYRNVVRKGVDWLIANQKPDGLLGERNYEHAIATMALAQAYAMSNNPALREPTQKAVDVILARQNLDPAGKAPYDRLGWDYVTPTGRNDASVTGWNVMALKSAMIAGLNVGEGISGSKNWLARSWKAANTGKPWCESTAKLDPYKSISRFGYVWQTGSNEVEISGWDAAGQRPESIVHHDLAPVGLLCAVFMGHQAGDPMLESMANYVSQYHMPTTYPCNTYYLYYNTLAMFQVGGERWERWAKQVLPMMHDAQIKDEGCMDGSWGWEGTQFHGNDTGRVLSTAYACLSMQVYWLYDKMQIVKKKV